MIALPVSGRDREDDDVRSLKRFLYTTPIILISGILAWYYFLPQEWH